MAYGNRRMLLAYFIIRNDNAVVKLSVDLAGEGKIKRNLLEKIRCYAAAVGSFQEGFSGLKAVCNSGFLQFFQTGECCGLFFVG